MQKKNKIKNFIGNEKQKQSVACPYNKNKT